VIKVPTFDGEDILTVPAGTQSGTIFRFKGKGIITLQDHGRGDLLVVTTIRTPTQLNNEQRRLLEELAVIEEQSSNDAAG
jgi:molecular chaperone DnaJ